MGLYVSLSVYTLQSGTSVRHFALYKKKKTYRKPVVLIGDVAVFIFIFIHLRTNYCFQRISSVESECEPFVLIISKFLLKNRKEPNLWGKKPLKKFHAGHMLLALNNLDWKPAFWRAGTICLWPETERPYNNH